MKKLLALTFALILVLSLAACGSDNDNNNLGNGGSNPTNVSSANQDGFKSDSQSAGEDQSWPTGTIYNVPEWEDITEYYGGGGSLDDSAGGSRTMKVDATAESFEAWLDTLRAAGYTVSERESPQSGKEYTAAMGSVSITITEIDILYNIRFDLAKIGAWPGESLPAFITQLADKTIVDTPTLYKPGADLEGCSGVLVDERGYNFQFTYTGLTKDVAASYMKDAASKLKDGTYSEGTFLDYGNGFCTIKGTYGWNGQNQYVYGEAAQVDDSTFTFYFGWSPNEMGW